MALIRFFVYASMLSGEPHHAELAGAKPSGTLRTAAGYALVELPTMAGLVRSREGSVAGEVYELERKVFLEVMKQARHPGLFQLMRIKLEDGTEVETLALTEDQARGKRRIANGDYRARFAPRGAAVEVAPFVRWARTRSHR